MSYTAAKTYGSRQTQGWNRIDMLLSLYEATLRSLDGMLDCRHSGDSAQEQAHRMKAVRQVLGIAAGLDLDQGPIAHQTARLCEFMHHSILEGDESQWRSARKVLATLHEAFCTIREEAATLEATGKIPQLNEQSTVELSV